VSKRKRADLLYFPGHMAIYLGNERYIHATTKAGYHHVTINSLDPKAVDYREDIAEKLEKVGSIF
jgi:cell wall-associated NlpC family hydrolase